MSKFCPDCGKEVGAKDKFCNSCGATLNLQPNSQNSQAATGSQPVQQTNSGATAPKSKLCAGLLGIFLGGWGIHNFYLGYTEKAVIQLVVTIVTCGIGGIWGFIEGIMILAGSGITTDAKGNPLAQ